MALSDSDQDKTEQATPFKLEEARRRGQVFKSPEITSLTVLSMGLLAALAFSGWALERMLLLTQRLLAEAGTLSLEVTQARDLLTATGKGGLLILAPLLVLGAIGGLAANILQTGPVFSFFPLKPDFKRINPAEGFKRVFSMRSVYEGVKAMLKLGILGAVLYLIISSHLPELVALFQARPAQLPQVLVDLSTAALFFLLLAFVGPAALDFAYSRWEYLKKMRMSTRELKDEFKRREGDPLIRRKRREAQQALRKRSASAGRVRSADVLIVNPIHLAVAVQYRRGRMPAPRVVAKGAGELALAMRRLAFHHGISIVENKALARDLYRRVALDAYIPEDRYAVVARILRRVAHRRGVR